MEITEEIKAYAEKNNIIVVNNCYLGVTIQKEFFPIKNPICFDSFQNLMDEVDTAKFEIKNALRKRRFMYGFMERALKDGVHISWTCDQFAKKHELMFIDIYNGMTKLYYYGKEPNELEVSGFETYLKKTLQSFISFRL